MKTYQITPSTTGTKTRSAKVQSKIKSKNKMKINEINVKNDEMFIFIWE